MKKWIPYGIIFCVSGILYVLIEFLWRGYSHWTMFLCAGLCGLVMANINNTLMKPDTDFRLQVTAAALSCTAAEFLFGIAFNNDFSIWDYRNTWGTIHWLGDQVNIIFILMWALIAVIALPLLDWMQWKLGLAEKPYYRIGRWYWRPWEEKE